VSLGAKAPTTLGNSMFVQVDAAKTVVVEVPSGATGYGIIPATYSGDDTEETWGNGFRGGSWNFGVVFSDNLINNNITLKIKYEGSE
jgi:hypothetical protein